MSQVAYLTGGASGIAKAVAQMLVKHNNKVFIADRDLAAAQQFVDELNGSGKGVVAACAYTDVADWNSQAKAFSQAVATFGRIDLVYPIAGVGERVWIPKPSGASEFEKPDLGVIDVNVNGVLYTVALAVQQFRKQGPGPNGLRGKIVTVASVCGWYVIPTLPIYTTSKHAVVGLVRTYGRYLFDEEKITFNGVCPHVVKTNISNSKVGFGDRVEKAGLYTPMEAVVETFEKLWQDDTTSGECFEVGPNYAKNGPVARQPIEVLDQESEKLHEFLTEMGRPLQVPQQ
ncbi:glucose 1-dehydrogenase [Fonsecaea erecta]|uniref:Glucose 1-dehydrogenase n=1 Tax=Fonsecaea erecta TaxID=1367422 RepID=A0A178Z4B9_9EURO|nr:glucose 1-dehydrogenase [Fonsecaea erecta]OAP54336.1 glucose 1-dehydrogenase [Fonsecaea erecta]